MRPERVTKVVPRMGQDSKIEWANPETWGNEVKRRDGYLYVRCPSYPQASANGYVLKHRLVMAAHLHRVLDVHEHVHHRNGDKQDNCIENLELHTNSSHRALHMAMLSPEELRHQADHLVEMAHRRAKPRTTVLCACGCGLEITTPDSKGRIKTFVKGHNQRGRAWKWAKQP